MSLSFQATRFNIILLFPGNSPEGFLLERQKLCQHETVTRIAISLFGRVHLGGNESTWAFPVCYDSQNRLMEAYIFQDFFRF
jgi:hypothetical protein